jgi:hypothetical protein
VEWELWFTTQDACGQACNSTRAFFSAFKATAEALERVSTAVLLLRTASGTDRSRLP